MFEQCDFGDGVLRLCFSGPITAEDESAYIRALRDLGARQSPFGLLAVLNADDGLSPNGRREQNLLYKQSIEEMNAHCVGLAIVGVRSTPQMQDAMERLWTFPVRLAENECDARWWLGKLIGHRSGGGVAKPE